MLKNIEAERARNQISKERLAENLGVSVRTYYHWIKQETDMPVSFLIRMSEMFGTTADYLLEGGTWDGTARTSIERK